MPSSVDEYMKTLMTPKRADPKIVTPIPTARTDLAPSPVRLPDETDPEIEEKVDKLFGQYKCLIEVKKESPRHRIMLWLRLEGLTNREIATAMGLTESRVSIITKQQWFLDAFVRLSTERGRDAVANFLEGEVMNTCAHLVHLRDNADSDAVKLAADREILDRVRGKPVAKSEMKVSGGTSVTVFDAAKLLEESKRNAEILKGRGIGGN